MVKASQTITFPSCTQWSEMNRHTPVRNVFFWLSSHQDIEVIKVCLTWDELTILLLSLHQSIHSTLLPCPFRVLRVFMTNWPRPSTFSATWCTAHRKTSTDQSAKSLTHRANYLYSIIFYKYLSYELWKSAEDNLQHVGMWRPRVVEMWHNRGGWQLDTEMGKLWYKNMNLAS